MNEQFRKFMKEEEGLTIVEYAVAAGVITATVLGAFTGLGAAVDGVITVVTTYI